MGSSSSKDGVGCGQNEQKVDIDLVRGLEEKLLEGSGSLLGDDADVRISIATLNMNGGLAKTNSSLWDSKADHINDWLNGLGVLFSCNTLVSLAMKLLRTSAVFSRARWFEFVGMSSTLTPQ